MRGLSWACIAAFVSCGHARRGARRGSGRRPWPPTPAAGIANAGASAARRPGPAVAALAGARLSGTCPSPRRARSGRAPATSVVRRPGGRAPSPTRTTCAPPASGAGRAAAPRARRASHRAVGRRRRAGSARAAAGPGRTAPAMPARQSPRRPARRRPGRCRAGAGYTARATPAASATASAPPMRVVFLVAKPGKPRSWRGLGASPPLARGHGRSPASCGARACRPRRSRRRGRRATSSRRSAGGTAGHAAVTSRRRHRRRCAGPAELLSDAQGRRYVWT